MPTTCTLHIFASHIDYLFSETRGDGHTAMNGVGMAPPAGVSTRDMKKKKKGDSCQMFVRGDGVEEAIARMWITQTQMGSPRDCVSAPPLLFFFAHSVRAPTTNNGDGRFSCLPNSGYKQAYQHHQHSIAIPEYPPRQSRQVPPSERWHDRPYFLMHETRIIHTGALTEWKGKRPTVTLPLVVCEAANETTMLPRVHAISQSKQC
jgi:hypothetical protein